MGIESIEQQIKEIQNDTPEVVRYAMNRTMSPRDRSNEGNSGNEVNAKTTTIIILSGIDEKGIISIIQS